MLLLKKIFNFFKNKKEQDEEVLKKIIKKIKESDLK